MIVVMSFFFFFSSRRRHTRSLRDWSSDVCSSDLLVPSLAEKYARSHPDARRLGPDEDPGEEPGVSATAEVSVLGVHGPFLSVEYHVDTSGAGDESWHMTRHAVVDLRTGAHAALADVLGPSEASTILARARRLYDETVDSIRR